MFNTLFKDYSVIIQDKKYGFDAFGSILSLKFALYYLEGIARNVY